MDLNKNEVGWEKRLWSLRREIGRWAYFLFLPEQDWHNKIKKKKVVNGHQSSLKLARNLQFRPIMTKDGRKAIKEMQIKEIIPHQVCGRIDNKKLFSALGSPFETQQPHPSFIYSLWLFLIFLNIWTINWHCLLSEQPWCCDFSTHCSVNRPKCWTHAGSPKLAFIRWKSL